MLEFSRHSIRLTDYDYTNPGGYFITICVQDRRCVLGEINDSKVEPSHIGKIVEESWQYIPSHFHGIILDLNVIMPNHFHGIIIIEDTRLDGRGEVPSPSNDETPSRENRGGMTPPLRKPTLGQVVGYFKYLSTKKINELTNNAPGRLWQRNYYEHIIRNEQDLYNARKYILENPLKWEEDEFYYSSR
jgi:putative transposase